MIGLFELSLIR